MLVAKQTGCHECRRRRAPAAAVDPPWRPLGSPAIGQRIQQASAVVFTIAPVHMHRCRASPRPRPGASAGLGVALSAGMELLSAGMELPTDLTENREYLSLAIALAIGVLFGLERGWHGLHQEDGRRVAGVHTFGLIGLLGGASGLLSPAVVAIADTTGIVKTAASAIVGGPATRLRVGGAAGRGVGCRTGGRLVGDDLLVIPGSVSAARCRTATRS